MTPRRSGLVATSEAEFEMQAFLDSAGVERTMGHFSRGETIFTQGEVCDDVMYIQAGGVRLSVLSKSGTEAVVAVLGPGDFFGEGCLAGQPLRMGTATTLSPSAVLFVGKAAMSRLLHEHQAMSDRFIAHILRRHIRIEEDLIDQLVSPGETRLAHTL